MIVSNVGICGRQNDQSDERTDRFRVDDDDLAEPLGRPTADRGRIGVDPAVGLAVSEPGRFRQRRDRVHRGDDDGPARMQAMQRRDQRVVRGFDGGRVGFRLGPGRDDRLARQGRVRRRLGLERFDEHALARPMDVVGAVLDEERDLDRALAPIQLDLIDRIAVNDQSPRVAATISQGSASARTD